MIVFFLVLRLVLWSSSNEQVASIIDIVFLLVEEYKTYNSISPSRRVEDQQSIIIVIILIMISQNLFILVSDMDQGINGGIGT